jgi:hypothetical protein
MQKIITENQANMIVEREEVASKLRYCINLIMPISLFPRTDPFALFKKNIITHRHGDNDQKIDIEDEPMLDPQYQSSLKYSIDD